MLRAFLGWRALVRQSRFAWGLVRSARVPADAGTVSTRLACWAIGAASVSLPAMTAFGLVAQLGGSAAEEATDRLMAWRCLWASSSVG